MNIQKMQDLDLAGKKVFLRADFNMPLDTHGNISNYKRINSTLPTIQYLLDSGCSIIISSHLGRPTSFDYKVSMKVVQRALRAFLRWPITLAPGVADIETLSLAKKLKKGEILLLENLRFDAGERDNSERFSKKLAGMADIYINDAFGSAHRNHSSVEGITHFFDIKHKGGGLLLQKEIDYFCTKLETVERPFIAILGGLKVSGKLKAIKKLLPKIDSLIIGGAMAFTFLKAQGYEVGNSVVEDDLLETAREILLTGKELGKNIYLPIDVLVNGEYSEKGDIREVSIDKISENSMGLDIGSKSIDLFEKVCDGARMIFWNGPMGAYEMDSYFLGSAGIANILAQSQVITFVGGGDSLSVIHRMGLYNDIGFLSTGGGASLRLLEGERLPGIEALRK